MAEYNESSSIQSGERVMKAYIEAFGEVEITINREEKSAYANGYGFQCWASIGDDRKLYSNSNDITTNYLKVAIVKALQNEGFEVEDIKPYPMNREITIL